MHSFSELVDIFETYFNNFQLFPNTPRNLYDPCNYALNAGGKRIRPILTLMASELYNDTIPEDAFLAAISFELFHNFTLIHDDIMDQSLLRRGRPAVYNKYGQTAAILSGDVMNIQAYNILGKIKQPALLHQLLQLFNKTAIEICEGQQLDMDYEVMDDITEADYFEMIKLKTSVLLAACLKAGGIIQNAADSDLEHLYQFGLNLGLAFQVQDDYLDTFGTEDVIGKLPGGDIRNNKKTILWLQLLEKIKLENDINIAKNVLNLDDSLKVKAITDLFIKYRIDVDTRKIIQNYTDKAIFHLNAISVINERKQALNDLTQMLINRKK
mgnify:CR=1 FL=1